MILVIDNYDSFVFNLVQYLGALGADPHVYRNDALSVETAQALQPHGLLISPGPGTPKRAGVCVDLIRAFAGHVPILGVCLGHQAIAEAFGGRVVRAQELVHGKRRDVMHDGRTIFAGLPNPFPAGRYHSLVVSAAHLPECLEVSAWTDDGVIMGLRHKFLPIEGVQFHPESILTTDGTNLLSNFLASCRNPDSTRGLSPMDRPSR